MERYAEWNKFIGNLKTDKYGATNVNEVGIAFDKATADVVPKSEVAREIFEEIEKIIQYSYYADELGEWHDETLLLGGIDELKKKYAEG